MPRFALLPLAGALLFVASGAALHADENPLSTFVPASDGAKSCWAGPIPDGTTPEAVTAMALSMQHEWQTDGDDPEGRDLVKFQLYTTHADGRAARTFGICDWSSEGHAYCAVECDGGAVRIELMENDDLLVDLARYGILRMRYCGQPGDETFALEAAVHGDRFVLPRLPQSQCADVVLPGFEDEID